MKKYLVLTILAITLSIVSFARSTEINNRSANHSAKLSKKQRHKLIKDLHLTKEQKLAWKASKKDFKVRQEAIKGNNALTEIQKKDQLRALHRERLEKMRSMLSPEQIKTFQMKMQNR